MNDEMNKADLPKIIDHTLLRPDAISGDVERICDETVRFGFHSVCVNPFFVPLAGSLLAETGIKVATTIGFPLGMTLARIKIYEAIDCVFNGADELDIVMNVGMAKAGEWRMLERDIADILLATRGVIRKIIVETCYLSEEEKIRTAAIVLESGAEFIKTSTGFGPGGARTEDVRLLKSIVKDRCGIKASGGIRTLSQVKELIDAGATRIGTSSGTAIMKEMQSLR